MRKGVPGGISVQNFQNAKKGACAGEAQRSFDNPKSLPVVGLNKFH